MTLVAAKVGFFGTRIIGGVDQIIKMERYEPRRVLNPRARFIGKVGVARGICGCLVHIVAAILTVEVMGTRVLWGWRESKR